MEQSFSGARGRSVVPTLSPVTPSQAPGLREHLTEAVLIPAVQLGAGQVCSITSASSSEHPQTSARLCNPYEGEAGPPSPTLPCSSFKFGGGGRAADH